MAGSDCAAEGGINNEVGGLGFERGRWTPQFLCVGPCSKQTKAVHRTYAKYRREILGLDLQCTHPFTLPKPAHILSPMAPLPPTTPPHPQVHLRSYDTRGAAGRGI